MRPILSSLSARLLFIASVVVAIPVVAGLFIMTLLGTAVVALLASLQARRPRAEADGPLVIEGEYTVVEAHSAPLRAPHRR
jgi:hypothetical protein